MLHQMNELIIYRVKEEDLLMQMAQALAMDGEAGQQRSLIYKTVKHLLDMATQYGWNHNLWHCALCAHLLMDENSYTLSKERRKEPLNGSIQTFLPYTLHWRCQNDSGLVLLNLNIQKTYNSYLLCWRYQNCLDQHLPYYNAQPIFQMHLLFQSH